MFRRLLPLFAALATALSAWGAVPRSSHVAIVVLENTKYSSVAGSPNMPWLNNLAKNYTLLTDYYANTHPSIGNYFMLTTGKIITNDDGFSSTVTADNVVRHLLTAGKTWKSYAESIPSVGYTGGDEYPYVRHHNPLAYFSDVRDSSAEKMHLEGMSQFKNDLTNHTLPNYMFIVPNMHNDMHDCPAGMSSCTLAEKEKNADNWLKANIAPLLSNSEFTTNGVLVIVWDESADSDTAHGGGHVMAVVAGHNVRRGYRSTDFFQHQSALRMMLQSLGLTTYPGAAATASNMSVVF